MFTLYNFNNNTNNVINTQNLINECIKNELISSTVCMLKILHKYNYVNNNVYDVNWIINNDDTQMFAYYIQKSYFLKNLDLNEFNHDNIIKSIDWCKLFKIRQNKNIIDLYQEIVMKDDEIFNKINDKLPMTFNGMVFEFIKKIN